MVWIRGFFSGVAESVVGSVIFAGSVAMITAVWGIISNLPGPFIFVAFLGALAFSLLAINTWKRLWPTREAKGVRFIEDRAMLNRATGGLLKEIEVIGSAWLASFVGAHASDHQVFKTRRVSRLILLDPTGTFIERFAPAFMRTADEIRSRIRETTGQARASGVEVHWFDGPITNVVIADPEREDGWSRIEIAFPFLSAAARPSLRFNRLQYPHLFDEIKRSYEELWQKSRRAPIEPWEIEKGLREGKDFQVP